jgi:hypothetical protein
VKSARERAIDITYDMAFADGPACVSKAAYAALAGDSGNLGADIRKLVGIVERHIEADRKDQQKVKLS